MGFDGQEEDQEASLNQGTTDGGYSYPLFNRALLSGFVPGAVGAGEGQAAAQSGAMQPIGERIVDMTSQQQAPSEIPSSMWAQAWSESEPRNLQPGTKSDPSVPEDRESNEIPNGAYSSWFNSFSTEPIERLQGYYDDFAGDEGNERSPVNSSFAGNAVEPASGEGTSAGLSQPEAAETDEISSDAAALDAYGPSQAAVQGKPANTGTKGQAAAAPPANTKLSSKVDVDHPLEETFDINVPAHTLPEDATQEVKDVTQPAQWQKVSDTDKAALVQLLVKGDMNGATAYAKAVLAGKTPAQSASGSIASSPTYYGPNVESLVYSPAWKEGRIQPNEKQALFTLLQKGDRAGAGQYAKGLLQVLQSGNRTPPPPQDDYNKTPQQNADAKAARAATLAAEYEKNRQWLVEGRKGKFGPGSNKCNEFVFDVLTEAGLDAPRRYAGLGGPVAAKDWADASQKRLGNWEIVPGPPRPGDVIAELTDPAHPEWAHVGIVVGKDRTASASTRVYPPGTIIVNDWGFRPGDTNPKVIRRYIPQPPDPGPHVIK